MKIVMHVGNGKTGTTSIQDSLIASEAALKSHGVKFLGFMLEAGPAQVTSWQRKGVNPNTSMAELLKLETTVAQEQIHEALQANVDQLSQAGFDTVIWSNERFFGHPELFTKPLQKLTETGHDIEIIAYVRRHDSWAKSVHNQWHLKRKRKAGPNLPFRDFISQFEVAYAPALEKWDAAFGRTFKLRNFDVASNVVEDFCRTIGLDETLVSESRSNDTPGHEETVLRALFNERLTAWSPNTVDPIAFERTLKSKLVDFNVDPVALTNDLLPNTKDLQHVVEITEPDREKVNALLEARGEAPLEVPPKEVHPVTVDSGIVDSVLFQLIARQALELNRLSKEVTQLKKRLDHPKQ